MPFNYNESGITGWTKKHWEETFFVLMKGIFESSSPYNARQRIPGPRSHHGLLADELEGFTRSFIMAGPWLSQSNDGRYQYKGETVEVADFYRKGIMAGTDSKNPEYWGDIVDFSQHLVECASLSWSLFISRKHIWDKYSEKEKKQVAGYLHQCTRAKYHNNNWLLFNVVTNTVLKKLGMPYEQSQIDENIKACEGMYIGEGWYRDGKLNRLDYYNAWAFHYYYLNWIILDGNSKPDIAEIHKKRASEFARGFRYFFACDGSVPCFGRSMIYRFGYLAPLTLGLYLDCLDVPAGEIKTMCNSAMKFFFTKEILTDNDHLSMGYIKPNADILEHYSCGGSPYWAAKAFNIFLLPGNHPYWNADEEKLPIHKENYSIPLKSAGFLLVGDNKSGHVQLVNQKSYHDNPEYNAKYTNFVYSSVFSYESRSIYKTYNCDNALQFAEDGINFRQRWSMENLYCIKNFNASKYPLFEVDDEGIIYTYIFVKDDFMINFHRVETKKNITFREGGYPLGFDSGLPKIDSIDNAEYASIDGKISFMRNLYGYTKQFKTSGFNDDVNGSNVRYRYSVVPKFGFENKNLNKFYLANMVYGKVGTDSVEQLMALVTKFIITENRAFVSFYDGEEAFMQIGEIENVDIKLNGKAFNGEIVMARVAKNKDEYSILHKDGKIDFK